MAHFAQLDENQIVTNVIAVNNKVLLVSGIESPAKGIGFCKTLLGGTWIQTSYNNNIRGTYAGIGYSYNEAEDIFITPQPYPSWIRSGSFWDSPTPYPNLNPDDETMYLWDEATLAWIVNELI